MPHHPPWPFHLPRGCPRNIVMQRCRKVAARCRVAGCGGRPWFAQPGSRVPKACKDHKEEGEVNIYTRTCEVDGCGTRPHYGMEGARARFCCTHKVCACVCVCVSVSVSVCLAVLCVSVSDLVFGSEVHGRVCEDVMPKRLECDL